VCNTVFTRPNAHIRGTTHACSRLCSAKLKPKKQQTIYTYSCKECNKSFTKRKGAGGTHEFCSIKCSTIARGKLMRGPNHPKWNNGSSTRSYSVRKLITDIISQRGQCELCSSTTNLQGHHINSHSKYIPDRANPDNIQVLCVACHAKQHPNLAKFILSGLKRA